MKQGEIWVIELDPAVGAEMKKTRPALIINDDALGSYRACYRFTLVAVYGGGHLYMANGKEEIYFHLSKNFLKKFDFCWKIHLTKNLIDDLILLELIIRLGV
jgi:hypothetical protein